MLKSFFDIYLSFYGFHTEPVFELIFLNDLIACGPVNISDFIWCGRVNGWG